MAEPVKANPQGVADLEKLVTLHRLRDGAGTLVSSFQGLAAWITERRGVVQSDDPRSWRPENWNQLVGLVDRFQVPPVEEFQRKVQEQFTAYSQALNRGWSSDETTPPIADFAEASLDQVIGHKDRIDAIPLALAIHSASSTSTPGGEAVATPPSTPSERPDPSSNRGETGQAWTFPTKLVQEVDDPRRAQHRSLEEWADCATWVLKIGVYGRAAESVLEGIGKVKGEEWFKSTPAIQETVAQLKAEAEKTKGLVNARKTGFVQTLDEMYGVSDTLSFENADLDLVNRKIAELGSNLIKQPSPRKSPQGRSGNPSFSPTKWLVGVSLVAALTAIAVRNWPSLRKSIARVVREL